MRMIESKKMHISRDKNFPSEITNPGGENIQEILGLQAGGIKNHSIAKILIEPGNSSEPHFHKESEESYIIIQGTASLKINNYEFELGSGEAVLIEPYELHQISNQWNENLVFLAVCVPAWHQDDSYDIFEDADH